DLAACLHREDLLHAGLLAGDLLDALETFDVVLQRLPTRSRPTPADAVRCLRQHRLDRADLHLVVVSLDRVDDVLVLAVLAVHVGEADVDDGVLAGPDAKLLDLGLAVLVDLLNAVRVDAAVEHELLEGEPADLPAYRVEAGEQHGFGGVVDDEVDPGGGLEGP